MTRRLGAQKQPSADPHELLDIMTWALFNIKLYHTSALAYGGAKTQLAVPASSLRYKTPRKETRQEHSENSTLCAKPVTILKKNFFFLVAAGRRHKSLFSDRSATSLRCVSSLRRHTVVSTIVPLRPAAAIVALSSQMGTAGTLTGLS